MSDNLRIPIIGRSKREARATQREIDDLQPETPTVARRSASTTTPVFAIYITVNFARTNHATLVTALEGRRAMIDTMLDLVRLCASRGWDLSEAGVGGQESLHKTMYVVRADLVDAPAVVPAVAATVGKAAAMRAAAISHITAEQHAEFEALCSDLGIRPVW